MGRLPQRRPSRMPPRSALAIPKTATPTNHHSRRRPAHRDRLLPPSGGAEQATSRRRRRLQGGTGDRGRRAERPAAAAEARGRGSARLQHLYPGAGRCHLHGGSICGKRRAPAAGQDGSRRCGGRPGRWPTLPAGRACWPAGWPACLLPAGRPDGGPGRAAVHPSGCPRAALGRCSPDREPRLAGLAPQRRAWVSSRTRRASSRLAARPLAPCAPARLLTRRVCAVLPSLTGD